MTITTVPLAPACRICGRPTAPVGHKTGIRTSKVFNLRRCTTCGFAFIEDPWTDYNTIYDEAYYRGKGSDPLVDYAFEHQFPRATIRQYEWQGILAIIDHLLRPAVNDVRGGGRSARWLDFGCGNAGLVRYVRAHREYDIMGFDTGAWAQVARQDGIPVIGKEKLARLEGTFDVITAIEVIEHTIDPLETLRLLRQLLKPGGVLFLTTGNADYAPSNFPRWGYVVPEIHVSFFTNRAMRTALESCGFEPFQTNHAIGWPQIVRFKVLKNLHIRKTNLAERILPWGILSSMIDCHYGVSALPAGRAI